MKTNALLTNPSSPARPWIKFLALGLAISLLSSAAFARDSTCLLGDNGKIALTSLEHRTPTGRATDVTLIYGMHLLRGKLVDTDSGPITLKEPGKYAYSFSGNVTFNYEKMKITVKGNLKFSATAGDSSNLNTTFGCKQLQPN